MKRIAAVLFALICLMASACAEAFTPPTIPDFTDDYGLHEFYYDLQTAWGPSSRWTFEQKAWLSENRKALLEKEILRCNALGWQAQLPFTYLLSYYTHGLPDAQAIDRATALDMAVQHLEAQGHTITPECKAYAGVSYLVDDPAQPLWQISFVQQGFHAITWMDAHTGVFSHISSQEAISLAWSHVVASGAQVARQPLTEEHLGNYIPVAYYHPADGQWEVNFICSYPAHEFSVTLDDTTRQILDMKATNG